MRCEDCGYCRVGNPKTRCAKLGMELEEDTMDYNQFYCGEVEKSDVYESRKI